MSDTIIKVEGLGKRYQIRHQSQAPYQTIREVLAAKVKGIWGLWGHVPHSLRFLGSKNLVRVPEVLTIWRKQGGGQPESQPEAWPESGAELLTERVKSLLKNGALSKSEISLRLD